MLNIVKSAFGGNSKIAISALSIVSVLVLIGGLTLNRATAQKNPEAENSPLRALASSIDSRLVDVPKACIADEVTISEAKAEGSSTAVGSSCEIAKARCRGSLAREVANKADKECKENYTKVQNVDEQCRAHRGNFNPTENIKYEPENCNEIEREHGHKDFFVACKIVKPVKYNCN